MTLLRITTEKQALVLHELRRTHLLTVYILHEDLNGVYRQP